MYRECKPAYDSQRCCQTTANKTRKWLWQLRMHCNLRPPEPYQPFPAWISTPRQVWCRWTYPLPYCSVFAADTLLYAVTLTFDLWPWTLAVYRLWRDETLYEIWTQSSNPRQSYCAFSVWLYDLKHCVTCCDQLRDNFHQLWPAKTYPCLIVFLMLIFLCHLVIWTFGPLNLNDCRSWYVCMYVCM